MVSQELHWGRGICIVLFISVFFSMEFSGVRWRDIASGNIYTRDAMRYDITTIAIPQSSFSS